MSFRPTSSLLALATALAFMPVAVRAGPWPAPIGIERLDALRGGFEAPNGMQFSFAIERAIFLNGELVATTRLVISDLTRLLSGGNVSAEILGQAFTIVQIGPGNSVLTDGAGGALTTTSAASPAAANAVTTNAAGPANAMPSQRTETVAAMTVIAPVAPPASATNAPAPSGTPPVAASAPAVNVVTPAVETPPPPSGTVPAVAGAPGSQGLVVQATVNGHTLVLPNASAIVTAVQNTVNNQIIEARTTINATLSSLSMLRSGAFAAALREQALTSIKR